ncbi:MAG TPA: hypothetical protein VG167_18700 [Verrucomicrobiae bacterium]|nr:hypothetical protein [Verrucomicrobiae bacterium]
MQTGGRYSKSSTQTPRLPRHHFYYLTRPDFLKHDHIHRRKVLALRQAGLRASLLSFVPRQMYLARQAEYQAAAVGPLRRVVIVPTPEAIPTAVRRFFLSRLLVYRRVLVQVLLVEAEPLLKLKQMRGLGNRLRCLIEHEGDIASECLYRWCCEHHLAPADVPPPEFKPTYDYIISKEGNQLQRADGAILVTPEHRSLWERRLQSPLASLALPTFFDPARLRFAADARARLRAELGLGEDILLVYSGSVSMPWQRFDSVCAFVAQLSERRLPVRLLALVHSDGHAQARESIARAGIEAVTRLMGVSPSDIAGFLSAADIGLFLRHNHMMNRVVTSAKLGEYLAAGLPLLTTWACPYYRPFVEQHSAALALDDSLELRPDFAAGFAALVANGQNERWRAAFSAAAIAEFSEDNDLHRAYVDFIRQRLE